MLHPIFSLANEEDVEVAVFQRLWRRSRGRQCADRALLYHEMFGDPNCEFDISEFTTSPSTSSAITTSSQVSLSNAMEFFSQESLQYADLYRSLSQLGTTISSLTEVPTHRRLGHLVHLQQLKLLFSDACQYLDNEMRLLLDGIKKEALDKNGGEEDIEETSDESYDESASEEYDS
jgi:hypothetical protein